ncbi:MAG TPA: EthD family reductase [Acidimicrobiales bacterium]
MIKLTILYPTTEGATFDHDYYRDSHVPLCLATWHLPSAEINKGVDGPYVAAVHFNFDSLDDMNAALALEGTGAIMADVANYTSINPVMQIDEIVVAQKA